MKPHKQALCHLSVSAGRDKALHQLATTVTAILHNTLGNVINKGFDVLD